MDKVSELSSLVALVVMGVMTGVLPAVLLVTTATPLGVMEMDGTIVIEESKDG